LGLVGGVLEETGKFALQRAVFVAILAGQRFGELPRLILQSGLECDALIDEVIWCRSFGRPSFLPLFAQCTGWRSTDLEQAELDPVPILVDRLHMMVT
jgi:hypothetical protein